MHLRSLLIAGAVVVVLLLAGTGGVYAYDHGKREQIAEGVRVNGLDVGGLREDRARAKLRDALLKPLTRPVSVRYHGQRFTLTQRQASIGVDIDGSVAAAVARSRQGSMFMRAWRDLRGAPLHADVDARITWSRAAVRRVVARVQRRLDREAVDARLSLAGGHVDPRPSKEGLSVRAGKLRRDVERELLDDGDKRLVHVRTRVVKPKVTTAQLAKKYPAIVIVNRGAFRLTLYRDLKLAKTYPIAVGQVGLETPAGLYHVQNKAINPAWTMPNSDWVAPADRGKVIPGGTPQNPLKARWLGIYNGAGIHGTDAIGSLGTAASHGCIRMAIPDVEELYDQVPVSAPVYIS
jgi:lipoprotein-anchoring transpeptidase ErfK/SrfK